MFRFTTNIFNSTIEQKKNNIIKNDITMKNILH